MPPFVGRNLITDIAMPRTAVPNPHATVADQTAVGLPDNGKLEFLARLLLLLP